MSFSSLVGSVWSLRGVDGPVVGLVEAADGEVLTLTVVGLGHEPLEGVEILPHEAGSGRLARVSSVCLLEKWKRMGAPPA